ncbi:MATE family efflux transporter [Flavonifractor sp. HCP28S3_F3]|uniref:MATE family efflux transporter n=1 Tax=Flavonifractor sp. HCP28S3_F3 TaxID=3438939 RepID=UPI003F8C0200
MSRSFINGSVTRQLLLFALPMMGAQLLQVTYSMVDAMVVGNFVSSNALGAVSIPGPVLWIASSIAAGMGAGTNIIIAQFFGADRQEDIRAAASTGTFFCILLGLAVSALCILTARPLLTGLLQTPVEMYRDAYVYLVIYSAGFLFQILYQMFYGISRALGDSKAALAFLLIAAVLNLVLDLVLVAGAGMGTKGAAIASVASQAGSAVAALGYLLYRYPQLRTALLRPRFHTQQMALIFRLSIPVTVRMAVQAAGFLLLQRLVNSFGPASIEGFAVMGKTEELMHIPVLCMSTALSSFVGQNMGAGLADRAECGIYSTLRLTLAAEAVLGTLMFLFDTRILSLYNITGEALLRGSEHLDLMCLMLPVFTVQEIINGALQGAGDVRAPIISSFTDLILRLSGTWLLSLTPVDFRSIYLSTPPAWIIACAISVTRFRRGAWKNTQLIVSSSSQG